MANVFDLNNPPKVPYVHQEFPRLVYRGDKHKLAHSAEDLDEALDKGWSKEPPVAAKDEDAEVSAESEGEGQEEEHEEQHTRGFFKKKKKG